MNMAQPERTALRRDLVWALLWGCDQPLGPEYADLAGGWVTSSVIWQRWLNGRNRQGCVYLGDYIPRNAVTRDLNRLVQEGRAEVKRGLGHHPLYRVVLPDA